MAPPKIRVNVSTLDGAENIFLGNQLRTQWSKVYETKWLEVKHRQLIPKDTETAPTADSYEYHGYTMVGAAALLAPDYTTNVPSVDAYGQRFFGQVFPIGNHYGWGLNEIRKSKAAGRPLDFAKQTAARRAMEVTLEQCVAMGRPDLGFYGFFTHPNVPILVLPADGTGSSAKLKDKTPAQIVRDLCTIANYSAFRTGEMERPNMMVLPSELKSYLKQTDYNPDSANPMSVLDKFLGSNEYITSESQIETWHLANKAGPGGVSRIVCYRRDPDALRAIIPQEYEELPPQPRGHRVDIYTHMRTGGTKWIFPLSGVYVDDVWTPVLFDVQ